jgi:hypothetical protein
MVAYSFQRRFVAPIEIGLGIPVTVPAWVPDPPPKRQTIRAIGKRRHVRAGEEMQLYHGMRTKQCFLIGLGTCVSSLPISLDFTLEHIVIDREQFCGDGQKTVYKGTSRLDLFARMDGFADYADMREFWREEHEGVDAFAGVIATWKPKQADEGDKTR